MKRTFVLLACVLACTLAGFAQNILTNGSFELPLVTNGSFNTYFAGDKTSIPGWRVVGKPGTNVFIAITSLCDTSPSMVCYPAQQGQQFLDLTGAGSNDNSEGVEVRGPTATVPGVPTIPGEYYQLSYWVGNVSIGGAYGMTSTAKVYIDGALLSSDTNSMTSPVSNGTTYLVWQQFIHVFQAGSTGSTRIMFLNGDPSDDGINGLDNVVLLHLCSCTASRLLTNAEAGSVSCGPAKVATKAELITN